MSKKQLESVTIPDLSSEGAACCSLLHPPRRPLQLSVSTGGAALSSAMQHLRFDVSDLPHGSSQKLLSSYFSLFGKVESCTYAASSRSAVVEFSASDDLSNILTARHRFLGSPIGVARASEVPAIAPSVAPDSLAPSLSLDAPLHSPSLSKLSASCDPEPRPLPPGAAFSHLNSLMILFCKHVNACQPDFCIYLSVCLSIYFQQICNFLFQRNCVI